MVRRSKYGKKNASQYGFKRGGRGRNRVPVCRYPVKKPKRR